MLNDLPRFCNLDEITIHSWRRGVKLRRYVQLVSSDPSQKLPPLKCAKETQSPKVRKTLWIQINDSADLQHGLFDTHLRRTQYVQKLTRNNEDEWKIFTTDRLSARK